MTMYEEIRLDEIRQRVSLLRATGTPDEDLEMLLEAQREWERSIEGLKNQVQSLTDDLVIVEDNLDTTEENLHYANTRIGELIVRDGQMRSAAAMWEQKNMSSLGRLFENWRNRS